MQKKKVVGLLLGLLCVGLCFGIAGCKDKKGGNQGTSGENGVNSSVSGGLEWGGLAGEFTLTSMFSANNGNIAVQGGTLAFYENGYCDWTKQWWDTTTNSSFSGSVGGVNGMVYSLKNGEVKVYQAGYSDVNHIGTFTYDGKHTLNCTYDKITMKWGVGTIEYVSEHHFVGKTVAEACYQKQMCDICSEWVKSGNPDSDEHTFVEVKRIDATCEREGEVTLGCTACGYEKWEALPKACKYDEGVCLTCGSILQGKKIELDIGFSVQMDGTKMTIFGEGDLSYIPYTEEERLGIPNILQYATVEEIVVSEGITGLQGVCYLMSTVKKVTLPQTLTKLEGTFIDCTELETIALPDSLTYIGVYTFYNCNSLRTIVGKNVTEIGESAFEECWMLSSIEFLKVEKIGVNAFYNSGSYCNESEVKIGSALKTIGEDAFGFCLITKLYFYGTQAEWDSFAAMCENQAHWSLIEADEIVIIG